VHCSKTRMHSLPRRALDSKKVLALLGGAINFGRGAEQGVPLQPEWNSAGQNNQHALRWYFTS
jgi:hypothetical protein